MDISARWGLSARVHVYVTGLVHCSMYTQYCLIWIQIIKFHIKVNSVLSAHLERNHGNFKSIATAKVILSSFVNFCKIATKNSSIGDQWNGQFAAMSTFFRSGITCSTSTNTFSTKCTCTIKTFSTRKNNASLAKTWQRRSWPRTMTTRAAPRHPPGPSCPARTRRRARRAASAAACRPTPSPILRQTSTSLARRRHPLTPPKSTNHLNKSKKNPFLTFHVKSRKRVRLQNSLAMNAAKSATHELPVSTTTSCLARLAR